jgi:hypothetical protein
MRTVWHPTDRDALLERLARLTPTTAPRWGRLTCSGMLAHVNAWFRMATGELPVRPRRGPLWYPPLRQLAVYVVPWPKSLPTAPELLARGDAAEFERERGRFPAELERFVARPGEGAWPPHAVLGPLSARAWGRLAYRHVHHHFTQFGV